MESGREGGIRMVFAVAAMGARRVYVGPAKSREEGGAER